MILKLVIVQYFGGWLVCLLKKAREKKLHSLIIPFLLDWMLFFLFRRSTLVPAEWGAEMIVTNTGLSGTRVSWGMGMV